jgi:hypothetical protein
LGKKVKKKKSTMAKEKFLHKKDWFTKELFEKTLKPKRCFGLDGPHIPQ